MILIVAKGAVKKFPKEKSSYGLATIAAFWYNYRYDFHCTGSHHSVEPSSPGISKAR